MGCVLRDLTLLCSDLRARELVWKEAGSGFELSFVWEGGGCDKNEEFVWVVCNLEPRS